MSNLKLASTESLKSNILLFLGTEEDKSYAYGLKQLVGNATVFTIWQEVSTVAEVIAYCKKRNITGVLCTQVGILDRLVTMLGKTTKKKPSIDNYQGSYFLKDGIEFVFIAPLKQLQTVSYGNFIARRFISKLVAPEQWNSVPEFSWEILNASNYLDIFNSYTSAIAIAVDIETVQTNLAIRCIGYTALFIDSSGVFSTHSCVLPIDSVFAVSIMRKFNWELQAPKVLQNGKYDCAYLTRYNAVLYNYLWDTANMFHSWYSELPKDLGFLSAFFIRKAMYWKDLADTDDVMEYYRYNALDTYGTILVFICWILESPQWAKNNYCNEFPVAFPCHLSEMQGIKRDMQELEVAHKKYSEQIEKNNITLSRMLGTYPVIFNTNSTPQNQRLRVVIGCGDLNSSDEKHLKKMGLRHPLNGRITAQIIKLREDRKLISTYLTEGKELCGYILYSLNPHGTDTTRIASKESSFWCGLQIQNIPTGPAVKSTLVAPEGWRIAENDLKQAESRDVAFLSGDAKLIAAVSSTRDFHAVNASAFFGTPYEEIFDDIKQKTLNKPLRDLSKRTNHGATYLMGWQVLIDTMGEDKIWEAKRLLKLPAHYQLRQIAEHLLAAFHRAYPTLATIYYPAIVHEVTTTRRLQHHACILEPKVYGITPVFPTLEEWRAAPLEGLTRYCFGDPAKNKLDKNSYVAHASQSLNAQALNRAYLRVFYEIAINPKYSADFKLLAQIHDSILYYFREGHEHLCGKVQECMQVPIRIKGYDNVIREFTVPADIKAGKDGLGAKRWSETE